MSQRGSRYASITATPTGARLWSIGLTAFVGSWVGHFFEYVRVAGWHAGIAEMSSSAHTYFFPAGAALTALGAGGVLVARRVWASLGQRQRRAEAALRRRPLTLPTPPERDCGRPPSLAHLWFVLTVLQLCTWTLQENLEAIGAGHRAPLLGVVSGAHWLAPVVQAGAALVLVVSYWVLHARFVHRRSRVVALERLVARKWSRPPVAVPGMGQPARAVGTPLERWGAQRWQRPPPAAAA